MLFIGYHPTWGGSFVRWGSVVYILFLPPTVGAYRIRPDVGEQEMAAANIPLCVIV